MAIINPEIPNIVMGEDYDKKYADALVHYDSLENLAGFFGRSMPVHRHRQYWQIHFIQNKHVNFHIDDRQYQLAGPCCFVTPAAVPHSFDIPETATGHVVTINQSLVWELANENTLEEFQLGASNGFCIAGSDNSIDWQLLEQTLKSIQNEWEGLGSGSTVVIQALTRILMVVLLRLSPKINEGSMVDDEDFRIYRKFSNSVEEHFTQHWTLQTYVDKLGVSEQRLSQICQRVCNNSPKRLINERLLQEAKRLLTHTSSSCNKISYTLGFSDPAYFSRFFKKQTGKTAQEYRKKAEIGFARK